MVFRLICLWSSVYQCLCSFPVMNILMVDKEFKDLYDMENDKDLYDTWK